jgi:hypothetical protein
MLWLERTSWCAVWGPWQWYQWWDALRQQNCCNNSLKRTGNTTDICNVHMTPSPSTGVGGTGRQAAAFMGWSCELITTRYQQKCRHDSCKVRVWLFPAEFKLWPPCKQNGLWILGKSIVEGVMQYPLVAIIFWLVFLSFFSPIYALVHVSSCLTSDFHMYDMHNRN